MNQIIRHRLSVRLARKLVRIVAPSLRPEERGEAFHEFYDVVHEGLVRFEAATRRKPPKPSRN